MNLLKLENHEFDGLKWEEMGWECKNNLKNENMLQK
jgi:hypothetical protein